MQFRPTTNLGHNVAWRTEIGSSSSSGIRRVPATRSHLLGISVVPFYDGRRRLEQFEVSNCEGRNCCRNNQSCQEASQMFHELPPFSKRRTTKERPSTT